MGTTWRLHGWEKHFKEENECNNDGANKAATSKPSSHHPYSSLNNNNNIIDGTTQTVSVVVEGRNYGLCG